MSKKSRALGLKVGVRVHIIRPPHNSRRMSDEDNTYDKSGIVTREGNSANGGWFEIQLDGTDNKLVYYRRGSLQVIDDNNPLPHPSPSHTSYIGSKREKRERDRERERERERAREKQRLRAAAAAAASIDETDDSCGSSHDDVDICSSHKRRRMDKNIHRIPEYSDEYDSEDSNSEYEQHSKRFEHLSEHGEVFDSDTDSDMEEQDHDDVSEYSCDAFSPRSHPRTSAFIDPSLTFSPLSVASSFATASPFQTSSASPFSLTALSMSTPPTPGYRSLRSIPVSNSISPPPSSLSKTSIFTASPNLIAKSRLFSSPRSVVNLPSRFSTVIPPIAPADPTAAACGGLKVASPVSPCDGAVYPVPLPTFTMKYVDHAVPSPSYSEKRYRRKAATPRRAISAADDDSTDGIVRSEFSFSPRLVSRSPALSACSPRLGSTPEYGTRTLSNENRSESNPVTPLFSPRTSSSLRTHTISINARPAVAGAAVEQVCMELTCGSCRQTDATSWVQPTANALNILLCSTCHANYVMYKHHCLTCNYVLAQDELTQSKCTYCSSNQIHSNSVFGSPINTVKSPVSFASSKLNQLSLKLVAAAV